MAGIVWVGCSVNQERELFNEERSYSSKRGAIRNVHGLAGEFCSAFELVTAAKVLPFRFPQKG
jgi:hypothetical protein